MYKNFQLKCLDGWVVSLFAFYMYMNSVSGGGECEQKMLRTIWWNTVQIERLVNRVGKLSITAQIRKLGRDIG